MLRLDKCITRDILTVPSPVMHPSANSDQLQVLSHAPVTHPRPSTPTLVLGTSNNTQHPRPSIPTSVCWASTNTQWTSCHPLVIGLNTCHQFPSNPDSIFPI